MQFLKQEEWSNILVGITTVSLVIGIAVKYFFFASPSDLEAHLKAYKQTQSSVHQRRVAFEIDWKEHPNKRATLQTMAADYLYETLTDSIFPYWYGTTWDFNGITQEPLKGEIACGYFVTTTLSHMSFFLPRVRMAQQPASIIIRSLCQRSSIESFHELEDVKKYMDKQEVGIYLAGLDTHVGYLWKNQEGLWFVHASYSGNKQVSKEKWNESVVLSKSKLFVIGNMLGNKALMEKWINGQSISISD